MFQAHTNVVAEKAAKYVDMLAHHFSRKVDVVKKGPVAEVQFPMGLCQMHAHDGALNFVCKANDADALEVIQGIIDRHIPLLKQIKDTKLDWVLSDA